MRMVNWALLLLSTLVIQATIVPLVSVNGLRPDLLLIVVVSTGMLYGKEQGIGIGFFAGLLQDLASGNVFGLNVLAKMAIGYSAGLVERKVFKENLILPLFAVLIATVCQRLLNLAFLWLFGYKANAGLPFIYNILPIIGYNLVAAIPLNRLVYRLKSKT